MDQEVIKDAAISIKTKKSRHQPIVVLSRKYFKSQTGC